MTSQLPNGDSEAISRATRRRLVNAGLASESILLRDAAAQSAEILGSAALFVELENHTEATAWLADYIAAVARDLKAMGNGQPASRGETT